MNSCTAQLYRTAALVLLLLLPCSCARDFSISYTNDTFMKDGKPYRYISGSLHYFRVPKDQWRDRLMKMKVGGLTTVQTYVEWSSHQPHPHTLDFEDNLDLEEFIRTVDDLGLDLILRPGPYIDAERDFGGLPYWLLKQKDILLRTADRKFFNPVVHWYKVLFQRLEKYLYKNGGPIIMIQVENEYGSYGLQTGFCDKEYLGNLRDLIHNLVGKDVVLFTTDGNSEELIGCGKIENVYATVDFGPDSNVTESFAVQRKIEPHGPLVNSEFYAGWLDHWQQQHANVSVEAVDSSLKEILDAGANVNIYMFHGGTSFGLRAGSNFPPFSCTPTSYDYNAPISESGDLGDKFWRIRSRIGSVRSLPPVPTGFHNISQKGNYGTVRMKYVSSILDEEAILFTHYGLHRHPLSFEDVDQYGGLILYQTVISKLTRDPSILHIPGLADRAYIYINDRFVGILSREENLFSIPVQMNPDDTLKIIVENQGRICHGAGLKDPKGITGNVTLRGTVLNNWKISGMSFDTENIRRLHKVSEIYNNVNVIRFNGRMSLWSGEFEISSNSVDHQLPKHTFLRLPGWHKGVVIINNFVLGRYWTTVGPQRTLYVPASILLTAPELNKMMILEQDEMTCLPSCKVNFTTEPDLDGPTPT